MFIDNVFYQSFGCIEQDEIEIKSRFCEYYNDLSQLYRVKSNLKTGHVKSISIEKMAENLFQNETVLKSCQSADFIFRPIWQGCLNPDYCADALFIQHRFNIQTAIIDVGSVGSLCQFAALDLMSHALGNKNSRGVVLALEQSSKNYFMESEVTYAEINFVSSLSLSGGDKKHGIEVIKVLFDNSLRQLIKKSSEVVKEEMILFCRNNLEITKLYELNKIKREKLIVREIPYGISSGFLIVCLNKIMVQKESGKPEYYLILDSDFESQKVAGVIVKY